MGGQVLYLNEDSYLLEDVIDVVSEHFYQEGLDSYDVEYLIDEMGQEDFADYALGIFEDSVLYEDTAPKKRRRPKPLSPEAKAAKIAEIQAGINKREKEAAERAAARAAARRATKSKSPTPEPARVETPQPTRSRGRVHRRHGRVMPGPRPKSTLAKPSTEAPKSTSNISQLPPGQQRIVQGAQEIANRVTSDEGRREIGRAVGSALQNLGNTAARGVLAGLKGHEAAMAKRRTGGSVAQQLGAGAGKAIGSFFRPGTAHLREAIEFLINEGYDVDEMTLGEIAEEYEYLCEKSVSKQQQKIFGLALAVKRGDVPRSEASKEVLDIVDSMSEAEIRKFAKTKHKGLPQQVAEEVTYEDIVYFMSR